MSGEPLDWSEGAPRSRRFDDIYFSAADGLAESRAVFLQGCGLPEAWAGRNRFTVGELGFGTGLNILALIELWGRTRAPGARLHVFSVEAFPLTRDDAARALAAWPELAGLAAALLHQWPDGRSGFHRLDFDDLGVVLDLAIGEAGPALQAWGGRADAWFLDGFAPARNPEMWRQALLDLVAARAAPGARVATFTVAGAVRRGLEAAGFAVDKRPGFGRKRERLEARLAASPAPEPPLPRVAVIGAGVAGAALVRAFGALGVRASVYEAHGPGAGASGNPAALVTPRLDAGFGAPARLSAQAFARAVQLYEPEGPEAVIDRGVLQLARNARDPERFDRLAAWDGFAAGGLVSLPADAAAAALDEAPGAGSLLVRDGLVVDPGAILERWLAGAPVQTAAVAALAHDGAAWRLLGPGGEPLGAADAVCLAAGAATVALAPLPLQPVRGQASWAAVPFTGRPAAWGGYAVPTRDGVLFGATHDRDDTGVEVRPQDHRRNLELLAKGRPRLAAALGEATLEGRASVRAATPDHAPLAGPVAGPPGLFVLSGLGGRGFTLAPLLAEHVAALAVGAPSPLPSDLAAAVAPARFLATAE